MLHGAEGAADKGSAGRLRWWWIGPDAKGLLAAPDAVLEAVCEAPNGRTLLLRSGDVGPAPLEIDQAAPVALMAPVDAPNVRVKLGSRRV